MTTYKIARRAFGKYEVIEEFTGSWVEAVNRCDALRVERNDGEYFEFGPGETVGARGGASQQSPFDYL